MSATEPEVVLVVEDDPGVASLQKRQLVRAGYRVETARTGGEALARIARGGVALVVLDFRLPDRTGLDVHAELTSAGQHIPVVLVTGFSDESMVIRALRQGVRDFVPKSVEYLEYLPLAVERILEQSRARQALRGLEEQLRQAQKMEAVGRLAGGVAHDFNNLLTVILGYGELVQEQLPPGDPLALEVAEILQAAGRGAALTRQLLGFSRQHAGRRETVSLGRVVGGLHQMLQRLIGAHIEVRLDAGAGPDRVHADVTQLEQVVLNLAVNARDAMPDGGRLTMQTRGVELDEAFCETHLHVTPGRYVVLAVSDTGCGMDAETRSRIFEPFFTTKPEGMGTGLGLATVYGIVTQSGGHIFVSSTPGEGTTFEIYLPAVADAAEGTTDKTPAMAPSAGGRVVLVVDDEDCIRSLAQRILTRNGYRVLVARNAAEAVERVAGHQESLDLLLTDVVMPGRSGYQLAAQVRELRPEVEVLFMSGYTGEVLSHQRDPGHRDGFLQKPFTAKSLLESVQSVLDRSRACQP